MKQKIYVIVCTLSLIIILLNTVFANDEYNQSINEEQSQISDEQARLQQIQNDLQKLNDSHSNLKEYMNSLNESYDSISQYIKELQEKIDKKNEDIDEINKELEKAETTRKEQYDAMKLRIKYMYESSDESYVSIFLSDAPLNEILNKVEYTEKMLDYDREKLQEYEDLLVYIEASKRQLEEDVKDLNDTVTAQKEQQDNLSKTMAKATKKIKAKEKEIDEAEQQAIELATEIQKRKDTIEELKAEESRRIESSKLAEMQKETHSDKNGNEEETTYAIDVNPDTGKYPEGTTVEPYDADEDEIMKMAAILYCEARGEPYEGILAVGSVVMNRVESPDFPNTVEEVILQPGQFSPVASGLYTIALARGANSKCIKAAKEILIDGKRIGPWHYFRTINNIVMGTYIGGHVFYG